jgi:signal transduction histidine kinase
MVLFFVGDRSLIMKITTVFGGWMSFAHLVILFYLCFKFSRNKHTPLGPQLFGFFLVFLLTAVVGRSMLQALRVIEGGSFLLQSPAWRGALFTLMLFGFLWYRDNLRNRTMFQNQIDIAISEARVKEKNLRMETQSQFMGMLMHELKTPLYIIQVAATSLSRHMTGSNPDTKRLDNIARAADDINFIIDRCVQADRLDQNDLQVHKTPVALKTLLSEVTHIKGNERVKFSGIDQAMVVTDYQFARIILINLVTNALKYSPAGSPIQLTVQETPLMAGQGLTLRVSNAVASAGRPDPLKVFTRYYRAEGAKKEVGAGLGLWLAHSLAIKLGHELRCSSDDESVHFEFSLEMP